MPQDSGITTPSNPIGSHPTTTPSAPAAAPAIEKPGETPTGLSGAVNSLKNTVKSVGQNGLGNHFAGLLGGPQAQELHQTLGQYKVPELNRWKMMNQLQQLQKSYQQGNYWDAYQQGMGVHGQLKQYHPGLPSALSPFMARQGAGTAWNALGGIHSAIGDPSSFARLGATVAPSILRTAGILGPGGLLGLYGLLSGNQQVGQDLRTLLTPSRGNVA